LRIVFKRYTVKSKQNGRGNPADYLPPTRRPFHLSRVTYHVSTTNTPKGVVELVDHLIRRAIAVRASDLHFEPAEDGLLVRSRVDGLLRDVERLPAVLAPNVIARLKVLGGLLTYRTDIPQEGALEHAADGYPCDIRISSFPTIRGERVVLRLMAHAHRFLTLQQLGHDAALMQCVKEHLRAPQGLLMACGPAGSGKTTTMYAMLDFVLKHRPGESILAVEDPVEIRLPGITQIQIEPARGLTYAATLRSLLRQDPQVLMIGEVRDAETAHIVIEAALTGHLLLTTIHSGTPAEAMVRLREMGVPAYQVTSTLRGVLAQRLVRTVNQAGQYEGRAACGHFVELTAVLRQAFLDGADAAELADPRFSKGSLRADAERLLKAGRTTEDEIRRVLGR
jgi:general secretion pathway protein E